MADERRVQFVHLALTAFLGVAVFFALPAGVLGEPPGADVANKAITDSAQFPVVFWCVSWPIAFLPLSALRILWTLGSLTCLFHIAVAFHVGHGWSHEHAWEHTRQVGGSGTGVYVNYAFALVWLVDAIWAWAAFESYRLRSALLNWSIHGFLAFIIFNAAVVFASWEMRIICASLFVPVAVVLLAARFLKPKPANKTSSAE